VNEVLNKDIKLRNKASEIIMNARSVLSATEKVVDSSRNDAMSQFKTSLADLDTTCQRKLQ